MPHGDNRSRLPRWRALDGLRGLAVAAVVAYHLGHLAGGFIGVDLFYVLSGFLITSLLLGEVQRTGTVDLRRFWARRARRLLPALGVMLVATVVAARLWLDHRLLPDLRVDALATVAYVANWRFAGQGAAGYFASDPSTLRHTWSLAIEEQFYLGLPLVFVAALWVARRRGAGPAPVVTAVALAGAAASAVWMVVHAGDWDVNRLYLGTDTRVLAPLVGVALAGVVARIPLALRLGGRSHAGTVVGGLGLAGLVVLAVVLSGTDGWLYRGGFVLVAVVAAAAVVGGVVAGGGPLGRLLSLPPLTWLGDRSYGIYLYSWPIQVMAAARGLTGAALAATTVGLALMAAAASYRWIEMPIRRGRLTLPRRAAVPAVAGGVALVTAALVVGTITDARPDPLRALSEEDFEDQALRPPVTTGDDALPPPPGPDGRPTAPDDTPISVLVVGDSVAYTLGVYAPAGEPGLAVDARALPGCGLLVSGARSPEAVAAGMPDRYDDCAESVAAADRLGLDGRPQVVLLVTGAWEWGDHERFGRLVGPGDEQWAQYLRDLLTERVGRLSATGARVALWADPCGLNDDVRRRQAWYESAVLRPVAAASPAAEVVDAAGVVCRDGLARTDIAGVGNPRPDDGLHWSEAGAGWLWHEWLAPTLRLMVGTPAPSTVHTAASPAAAG
ncbi:MAG TPA: acyltransferase family protein [Acidimicrobiales bacterium]|nr:acyltransferase family protein [Acidimicrobiales bacterium]